MDLILDRFFGWMTFEPVIGLMMIVATVVLFIGAFRRRGDPTTAWQWLRRIIEAGAVALLFLGLLWAFRAILNDNAATFRDNHGRVSAVNYDSLMTIWGSPHVQRELQVDHYIEVEEREEIPRPDPADPPLYRTFMVEEMVEQNSILAAKGEVLLTLNKRKKGSAYYNGFETDFRMTYEIVNDSPHTTEARFMFPLSDGQVLFENFKILEGGVDISRHLRFSWDAIRWTREMKPGEKRMLEISYASRGVEHFYFQIPVPREINDFSFRIVAPNVPLADVNYPEGCLTPTTITASTDGLGTILEWTLDNAVTTAGMGIALPKPEQPGAKVSRVLGNSPYALMLLIVAVCLTFLIRGQQINFLEISLLSAVYCVLFLVMASVSDYYMGFIGSLVVGAGGTLGLSYLLYRRHPLLTRALVMSLVAFFTLLYPLSALFPEHRESVQGMVVVGLIVYLFLISLHARLQTPSTPEASGREP